MTQRKNTDRISGHSEECPDILLFLANWKNFLFFAG